MADQEERCCSRVSRKRMLVGRGVSFLKGHQKLFVEGGVNVTTLIVFSLLFCVLSDDLILVKGGCPCWNYGRLAGVGQSDKGDLDDKRM